MQPTFLQLIRHPGRPARRGTSLIEILVVLVILVVGILSIVRLFPAGFLALRNAENNTFADRLAQGALEQLKKGGNGLPDAIYMYSDADGFNPNFAPGDFDKAYTPSTTGATVDASYNDVNKQRYISNETITVPATRMTSGMGFLPIYVVNYGPISLPANYTAAHGDALKVNSLPWTPQMGDSRPNPSDSNTPPRSIDEPTDILQAGQQKYLVDYNAGALAVPQALYSQNFYVQVTLFKEGPQVPVLITVPATIGNTSTDYNGSWFSNGNAGNVVGTTSLSATAINDPWTSVTLSRPFRCVADTSNSPTFSADPYEFAVFSSNFDGTSANPGVIAFNPLASGRNGTPPLQARISYMTADWHILHEDHDVSAGTPTVRLTLGHLKKFGDVQFDQTTYNGLISAQNAATNATYPADIIMLNLDSGQVTTLNGSTGVSRLDTAANPTSVIDADQASGSDTTKYQVSYQNGRVTFPDNTPAQHLRFYYAGDADWALSVQKAPSVYIHSVNTMGVDDPAPLTQTSKQKAPGVTTTPNLYATDATNQRVLFPLCDAGKTVEFDGISYTDKNTGKVQTVNEGTAQISTVETSLNSKIVYVNLSSGGLNSSSILTNADATKPITFQAVRGISAQATVIWHERNRWRSRTIDTLLTQTP